MKFLKTTLALLCLAFAFSSCSEDDDKNKVIIPGPPVGFELKYEVSVTANMITQISYRLGDGDTFYGSLDPDASPTQWSKLLVALYTDLPETAFLQVKCINTTTETQNCTLKLYRGTELISTKTDLVAPADNNEETDDTVTSTLIKNVTQ